MNIFQNSDGSFGLGGTNGGAGEFIMYSRSYTASSGTASSMIIASRPMIIKSIIGCVETLGTDAGAVTASFYIAPSGTALASGTIVHSGTYNLKGTINTNQVMTLTSAVTIPAGSRLGVVLTGVLTAAVGAFTVALCPA